MLLNNLQFTGNLELNFFIYEISKSPQYEIYLSFRTCQNYIAKVTDRTYTIY